MGSELLRLSGDGSAFGILHSEWQTALRKARREPKANVRPITSKGSIDCRFYVASIFGHGNCHFHLNGKQEYAIVSGNGILHWGKATKKGQHFHIDWEEPACVQRGDSFVIPRGYAHQLRRAGGENLVVLIAGPETQVNGADRIELPNAPKLFENACARPPVSDAYIEDDWRAHDID